MAVVKSNLAMTLLCARMAGHPPVDLDPELAGYVARGLAIDPDGTIVAVAAAAQAAVTDRSRFQDRVGYESVVNKVRLGDWASARLKQQALAVRVAHAVRLADVVGEVALTQGVAVTVIISVISSVSRSVSRPVDSAAHDVAHGADAHDNDNDNDNDNDHDHDHDHDHDFDVVFRFHGQHAGEVPWLSDPEGYAEPIMVRSYPPPTDLTERR